MAREYSYCEVCHSEMAGEYSNFEACPDTQTTKTPKMCHSCTSAEGNLFDLYKPMEKKYESEMAKVELASVFKCGPCKKSFSSKEERRVHRCQEIKNLFWEAIENIGDEHDIGWLTLITELKFALIDWMHKDENSEGRPIIEYHRDEKIMILHRR